jgi:type I restriction enzyme S subunit
MEVTNPGVGNSTSQCNGNQHLLPRDWQIRALTDLVEFLDGMRRPVKETDRASMRGDIPYYGASGIVDYVDKYLFDEELVLLSEDGENIISRSLPLAFRITGKAWVNNHAHVLRPKTVVDARFLTAYLESLNYERFNSGTAQPKLNKAAVANLAIALPKSYQEQSRIADALTDTDALIDSLEQLLTKKRQIKQGAMQELLTGKRRLPGFTGRWAETTLFDLAGRKKDLFDDGDWIESEHIRNEGIRLIQTGNIGVGRFIDKEEKKYIDDRSFSQLRCKPLQIGDLLICRLADPAGRACVLPNIEEDKVVTSVDVTIFRPSSDTASREFLAQFFSRPMWFKAVGELSGGTTHKRIARGALGHIGITLPGLAEQAAIAEVLSDLDAAITAIESRLTKARALKQAMAQALLAGRIRLVEPTA